MGYPAPELHKHHQLCNLRNESVRNLSTYASINPYAFLSHLTYCGVVWHSTAVFSCLWSRMGYPAPELHKHHQLCNLRNESVRNLSTYASINPYAFLSHLTYCGVVWHSTAVFSCLWSRMGYPAPELHKHHQLCNLRNGSVRNLSTYASINTYAFLSHLTYCRVAWH